MFFPTEQNLRGLKKVVSDIRFEGVGPRRKHIDLHFVCSNVPDLDDENKTLENRLTRFKEGLGYEETAVTIHHNDSLTLLNQVVFTRDHPRSRLTTEYRELAQRIVSRNLADREAALTRLQSALRGRPWEPSADNILKHIGELHSNDAEVLGLLASVQSRQGRVAQAIKLLSDAIKVDGENPHLLRRRAQLLWSVEDQIASEADVIAALNCTDVNIEDLSPLVALLRKLGAKTLEQLPTSNAVRNASAAVLSTIADELMMDRRDLAVAVALLEPVRSDPTAILPLSLCLIGLSRYAEAKSVIEGDPNFQTRPPLTSVFNHAMAVWGETGDVPISLMGRVVELALAEASTMRFPAANYLQCLAVASWAVGNRQKSADFLRRAQERIMATPAPEFSCWQYLTLPALRFYEDLDEMSRLLDRNTNEFVPAFMRSPVENVGDHR
jgi:tetratricopeptide (TPR) repeat protein